MSLLYYFSRFTLLRWLGLVLFLALTSCSRTAIPPAPPATTPSPGVPGQPTPPPVSPDAPAPTGQPIQSELDQAFTLAIGEEATIAGLRIIFRSVDQDSRCPTQVTCAWEGAVDVIVAIEQGGQPARDVSLRLYGSDRATSEAQVIINDLMVQLLIVTPYPSSPGGIDPVDYRASLIVTKAPVTASPTPSEDYTIVEGPGYRGAIVAEQHSSAFDPHSERAWSPTAEQIATLEAALPGYLKTAAAERSPDLWQKQAQYLRQYAGIVRDGQPLIYVSALCSAPPDIWQHQPIIVMDGGDCYFQVTWDPQQAHFVTLIVNGNA